MGKFDKACLVSWRLPFMTIAERARKISTRVHGWFAAMQTREGIQKVSFVQHGTAEPRSWRTIRVRPENWSTWTENRMARFRISCCLLSATRLRSRPPSARSNTAAIFLVDLALQPLAAAPLDHDPSASAPVDPDRAGSGALRRRMGSLTTPCLVAGDFGDEVAKLQAPIFFLRRHWRPGRPVFRTLGPGPSGVAGGGVCLFVLLNLRDFPGRTWEVLIEGISAMGLWFVIVNLIKTSDVQEVRLWYVVLDSWIYICVVSEEGRGSGGCASGKIFSFSSPKQWGFVRFRVQERLQNRKTVAGWELEDIFKKVVW